MKYISSFIHVPTSSGNTAAIDVTKIDNITGTDNDVKVYTTGSGDYLTIRMNKVKFIDTVEDKRRELWMNERAAQIESSKLMMDLIESVHALNGSMLEPDPQRTVDETKDGYLGNAPVVKKQEPMYKEGERVSSFHVKYDPNKA